jgi:hypothetical protein
VEVAIMMAVMAVEIMGQEESESVIPSRVKIRLRYRVRSDRLLETA